MQMQYNLSCSFGVYCRMGCYWISNRNDLSIQDQAWMCDCILLGIAGLSAPAKGSYRKKESNSKLKTQVLRARNGKVGGRRGRHRDKGSRAERGPRQTACACQLDFRLGDREVGSIVAGPPAPTVQLLSLLLHLEGIAPRQNLVPAELGVDGSPHEVRAVLACAADAERYGPGEGRGRARAGAAGILPRNLQHVAGHTQSRLRDGSVFVQDDPVIVPRLRIHELHHHGLLVRLELVPRRLYGGVGGYGRRRRTRGRRFGGADGGGRARGVRRRRCREATRVRAGIRAGG
mmetsp:Transcript_5176/g.14926  ORF Transcript_5176/g.14926 Transcript_5176/m.14926 type:complete len:289 (-) Transcript_5176:1473-2339(-)